MSKSILDTQKGVCFRCGRYGPTDKHHIFGGSANRRLSEEDGLWVYLCRECHNQPPKGAHFNPQTALWLHRIGQEAYEREIGTREGFMQRYGKNYL